MSDGAPYDSDILQRAGLDILHPKEMDDVSALLGLGQDSIRSSGGELGWTRYPMPGYYRGFRPFGCFAAFAGARDRARCPRLGMPSPASKLGRLGRLAGPSGVQAFPGSERAPSAGAAPALGSLWRMSSPELILQRAGRDSVSVDTEARLRMSTRMPSAALPGCSERARKGPSSSWPGRKGAQKGPFSVSEKGPFRTGPVGRRFAGRAGPA